MDIKSTTTWDYQTNCYVITINNKDIIIDPGVNAILLKIQLKTNCRFKHSWHFDHVWSNQAVKETYNIPLYTPKDDEFMLTLNPYDMVRHLLMQMF